MANFDELKKQIDEQAALVAAREKEQRDLMQSMKDQQARTVKEREQKVNTLAHKVVKPALVAMNNKLGLTEVKDFETHEQISLPKVYAGGHRSSVTLWQIAEFTFTKPASANKNLRCGFLFGLDGNHLMSVFSGMLAVNGIQPSGQAPTKSGLFYTGDELLGVGAAGDLDEAKLVEIRTKIDDALFEGMKAILALR